MRKLYRFVIAVSLFVLLPIQVNAAAVDVELNYYSKASHLVNSGRYQQASKQWHRLTILFLSSEAKLGRKKMWQYAGLSEALAAISADMANDAMAYQYWADSTRYLMTGGTNWKQMKKKLHRRYEHANTLLSTQLQVADLAASIDSEWENELAVLQTWDEKLSIFRFESPKLGLADRQEKVASNQPLNTRPTVIPAYQPPQGGKKLSGLNTSYSKEQHVLPTGEQNVVPTKNASSLEGDSEETVSQAIGADSSSRTIQPSAESSVSRHLVVSGAEVKLDTAPVMSKGIDISGASSVKVTQSSDPQKTQMLSETVPVTVPLTEPVIEIKEPEVPPPVDASGRVIVTPLEAIEYEEQDLKQMATPNKQSHNHQLDIKSEQMTFPSGHFEQPEKHTVAPLQRRSFAPISQ
ncbi:hypothetical protein ACQKPX_09970 [Photobacterium sp. DNB23_23_1]